ncbi:DUF6498-containing protein [Halolamina sp. C58]|uniref:DUF6498-containing protein n=1 Tax=Halolamina sp. C58 TaxID=3421640 RepID=UPI003EB9C143
MAENAPDLDAVAVVIASNLVVPAGVLLLDWSIAVLFGVLVAELAIVFGLALVKIPFAAKRSRGSVDRSRLAGLVHRLRGSIPLPGPIPGIYPRNLPPLFGGAVIGSVLLLFVVALFGFVAGGGVTDDEAAAIALGLLTVLVLRTGEELLEYFVRGGYREHSAQSAFAPPFTSLLGVGSLLVAGVAVDAAGVAADRGEVVLALLVGGKLLLDLWGLRIEADEERHGVLARMFGSTETAVDPEPVDEPAGDPTVTVRPSRSVAVVDALVSGLTYGVTSPITFFAFVGGGFGLLAGGFRTAAAVAAIVLAPFVAARAVARYLTYGAVEYRCYDGLLVVDSTLLDAAQARLRRQAVDGVTIDRDLVDRAFDTETLALDADGPDTTPDFGLPDPDEEPDDGVNADRPRTLPHLRESGRVVDALGVRWILERDR